MRSVALCFPITNTQVLLGRKRRGFGLGKVVGFGGGIEPGETPPLAAVRELFEESGLVCNPNHLQPRGIIEFWFTANPSWNMRATLFVVTVWHNEPQPSAEMEPLWCSITDLPLALMWDDVRYWLPTVLAGESRYQRMVYGEDNATVVAVEGLKGYPTTT
jgi:8-oxo-dGTP diphosphatase